MLVGVGEDADTAQVDAAAVADHCTVAVVTFTEVEPAEAQAALDAVQLSHCAGVHRRGAVPLGPRLMARATLPQRPGQVAGGRLPQVVEPVVEDGDVALLLLELRVGRGALA